MNDMKKLLQEFKKNLLKEEEEERYSSNIDDAYAVIKYFIAKNLIPDEQQVTNFQTAIGHILAFAEIYKKTPILVDETPEDKNNIQKLITDRAVQKEIVGLLDKMYVNPQITDSFIDFLEIKQPGSGEHFQKELEKFRAQKAQQSDGKKRVSEPVEIGSGDIAPLEPGKTSVGRAGKRQSSTSEDSEIERRRKMATGNKTQP